MSNLPAPDPREDRLPKWAQNHMAVLRMRAQEWMAKATEGPEDSDTFTWGQAYEGTGQPLGHGTTIEFHRPDGSYYAVHVSDEGTLLVSYNGHRARADSLLVCPQSANRIRITPGEYPR